MSIKARYGHAVRKQLRHFPVWDIGAPVAVGDYGLVDDGCFTKLGNLAEFSVTVATEQGASPSFWEFTSEGARVSETRLDVELGGHEGVLELAFAAAYSLYVRADASRVTAAGNANEIGRRLRDHRDWRRELCFVSSVRTAESLVLLMNTRSHSTIELRGSTSALTGLLAGRLDGASALQITGDAGLKSLGVNGAFYVDLMRVGFFGLATRGLGHDGATLDDAVAALDPLEGLADEDHGGS